MVYSQAQLGYNNFYCELSDLDDCALLQLVSVLFYQSTIAPILDENSYMLGLSDKEKPH